MSRGRAARTSGSSTDEDGGEGYFASVSDLMVGVLFVFLLMLTVFALNFRDAEQAQTVEREKYEQALRDLQQQRQIAAEQEHLARAAQAEAARQEANAQRELAENQRLRELLRRAMAQIQQDIEDRAAARLRLLASLQQALREQHIEVAVDPTSGILHLSGDLLFQTGSASLGQQARMVVQTLADVMAKTLPCYAGTVSTDLCAKAEMVLETVLVEGHTDRQRFRDLDAVGSQDRNDRLSADRALAVFLELRRFQPSLDLLRNGMSLPLLGVSGYGERRPRSDATCNGDSNCPDNRRIDLRFVLSARTSDEVQRMLDEIGKVLGERP
jgi:chemotaxis protein MotB